MDARWTLDELTRRVDDTLAREGIRQENGQVAEAPNGRTIRWYQSTGLLRRPEQRGRVAFYGPAHLAELVAIKRLQSEGLSLTAIETRLHGLGDDELFALAALPAAATADDTTVAPVASPVADVAGAFWGHEVSDPVVNDVVQPPEQPHAPIRQSLDHPAGVSLVLPTTIDADVAQALLQRIVDELAAGGHLPATSPVTAPSATTTEEDR